MTELAAKMGVDAVYVDKFSNAAWVRAALDELPRDYYHIRDVEKPLGLEPIRRLIRNFTGDDEDVVFEEIQAVNVSLWIWASGPVLKRSLCSSECPARKTLNCVVRNVVGT
jgi:hypothetical protein